MFNTKGLDLCKRASAKVTARGRLIRIIPLKKKQILMNLVCLEIMIMENFTIGLGIGLCFQ